MKIEEILQFYILSATRKMTEKSDTVQILIDLLKEAEKEIMNRVHSLKIHIAKSEREVFNMMYMSSVNGLSSPS